MEPFGFQLPPLVPVLDVLRIYESPAMYYLVLTDKMNTRFRLLKVERYSIPDVSVSIDPVMYTAAQVRC